MLLDPTRCTMRASDTWNSSRLLVEALVWKKMVMRECATDIDGLLAVKTL